MKEENLSVSDESSSLENNEEVKVEESNVNSECEALQAEVDSLKDKILRISAEYDNYRKRSIREKNDIYGDACIDVISQILPILDNLERASSVDSDIDSLKQGISMVIKMFNSTLEKLNVKEIDSTGEFNPNLHEAVMHINDESLDKNTVVEVLQKGYIRNDKVIRHSMVKVAN